MSGCTELGHGLHTDRDYSSMLHSPSRSFHAPPDEETSQPHAGWLRGRKSKLKRLSQGESCLRPSTVLAKVTFPLKVKPKSEWRLGDCRQAVWNVGKLQSSGWRQVPRELAGDPRATLALLPVGMRPDLRSALRLMQRYLRTGAMV